MDCFELDENEIKGYINKLMVIYNKILDILRRKIDFKEFICRRKVQYLLENMDSVVNIIGGLVTSGAVCEPYFSSRINSLYEKVEQHYKDLLHYGCFEVEK